MKKVLFFMFIVSIFVGCSHYGTKWSVDSVSSPDSTTQLLRNNTLFNVAKDTIFFNKDNIQDLCNFIKMYKKYSNYFKVIENKTTQVFIQSNTINNFIKEYKEILAGKIFIEIKDSQIFAGNNECNGLFSSTTNLNIATDANLKYDENRKNLLKELIKDELVSNGFNVTNDIESSKYKLKIFIVEDGMTAKHKISILYKSSKKTGVIGLNAKFVNTSNNKIILAFKVKDISYLTRTDILYFIPTYSSSEDLDMEY